MVEWRTITEFPDYEISECGQVRRGRKSPAYNVWVGRELKTRRLGDRYLVVSLYRDGARHLRVIHRLVAIAFLGAPPTPQHEAAHNDGSKINNHYSNLRWATHQENLDDRRRHGTHPAGSKNPAAKLSEEAAREIKQLCDLGDLTITAIAAKFEISRRCIQRIRDGEGWNGTPLFARKEAAA